MRDLFGNDTPLPRMRNRKVVYYPKKVLCLFCNEQFEAYFSRHRFCSTSCARKHKYQRNLEKNRAYTAKWWRDERKRKAAKRLKPKGCMNCEEKFRPKKVTARFCSKACALQSYGRMRRGSGAFVAKPRKRKAVTRPRPATNGKYTARSVLKYVMKIHRAPSWLTAADLLEMEEIYKTAKQLGLHVDHILPLKGKTVSGLHVPSNLQMIPAALNMAKGNKAKWRAEDVSSMLALCPSPYAIKMD